MARCGAEGSIRPGSHPSLEGYTLGGRGDDAGKTRLGTKEKALRSNQRKRARVDAIRGPVIGGRGVSALSHELLAERLDEPGAGHALRSPVAAAVAATRAIGAEKSRQQMLTTAARELARALDAHACTISRLEDDLLRDCAEYAPDAPIASGVGYHLSDYPATAEVIRTRRARIVSASDPNADPAELFVLRKVEMQSVLMLALYTEAQAWGLIEIYDRRPRSFSDDDANVAELITDQMSALLSRFEHERALEVLYHDTLASLSNALEAKDRYTRSHTHGVADLAVAVGQQLELDPEELRTLELGALLHDIGKIRIPESILNKPGQLTAEEWELMKTHPVVGEQILRPIRSLRSMLPIVRSHHERWVGNGYPDGTNGDRIPLGARIVAVCDAYGAMTEKRPYREALRPAAAQAELRACSGTQFDPTCVDALLGALALQEHPLPVVALRPPGS